MEITVRFPNLGFLFEYEDRIFSVLGFDITIYGILMAVSLLIGLGMILLCARWQKLNLNLCLGASISALVGGVIGGRLYYIAFSWSQFSGKSWKILCDIRSGGISIYGAILGGVLVAALFCRLSRTSFWKMADIVCMGLLSGQIIGVWGNFFNREAFGEYTDSLFAMGLPMDSVQKSAVTKLMKQHLVTFRDMDYIQVHPLFFYESIWCLLLLLILLLYTWRKKFEGEIFLRYLAGYGLGKCVIEWLRTDKLYIPKTKIPVSLLVSAALFLICGIVATVRRILSKKREKVSRRRREERNAPEEKNDGSRLEDIHNFENVQDEFRDILEELDRAGKMVAEEDTESNESEDSKSAETAETTETEVSESVEDAEAAEAPASAETVESESKGTEGSDESAEAEPEAGPDDREDV